jgi:DnaJ homolog subfamily C member 9
MLSCIFYKIIHFQGSDEERDDVKEAYNMYKGDMNSIMDAVPFAGMEDEERLTKIIEEMIESEEVEDYEAFSQETAQKKKRRKQKVQFFK